ncbi:isopentenyl-diphosphate delta-isomerase [Collibacillus ludicampi]|uniref:Isopentenyl-diphosphate delta-isomerase n=1 Tax=Collibacillus ludicampi TaxID=2771369 RepID=A0AAV4LK48_9BACL|nr:type 2 isopentenyl-diphosphate Delta-isomerase [Collibacillus ludicampi]GIM48212.1 isopentenyl-diphosphate delta-isomerase [Collibacillus ludicampi]
MSRETRKLEHIRLALAQRTHECGGFEDIRFVHQSLPESDLSETALETRIGELTFSSPILINAMTGGADKTKEINRKLAIAAAETGVAMAVGSQRAAIVDPALIHTYSVVREVNPQGIIAANLGADASVEDAIRAVEMIQADLLQLHVNVPQELIMPEGDRSFRGIRKRIAEIVKYSPVPVIVKEVGFGMSYETYKELIDIGVRIIDVGGRGGTNFIRIENERRKHRRFVSIETWGQSAAISLLEAGPFLDRVDVIASGGIRNALDVAKSLSLGASVVGIAGSFLRILQEEGLEALIDEITHLHEELRVIMTILGCNTISELRDVPLVITGFTADWCHARTIDIQRYATRCRKDR